MMVSLAERFFQYSASMNEEPTDKNSRVLLIDGLNTYIRAFTATPTMDDVGGHIGGITGFLLSIGAAIRSLMPTRVIICFDGAGGSTRRRNLFKDYKAKRRNMTRLNRTYDFASLEEEKEVMKWQLMVLIGLLEHIPVTILSPDNVEADDVIAYLAQYVEEQGGKSIILSTDKDFLQLVNDNITVYNPVKKKMYRTQDIVNDFGFHPNNFLLYRVVTGDNSDCIPGVEGIKEKTLLKFFPELALEERQTIDKLLETAQAKVDAVKTPPVALARFVASRKLLELNHKLMRLDDVAMSASARLLAIDRFNGPINKLDKMAFIKAATQCKIVNTFTDVNRWLDSSFNRLAQFGRN
jgi:5'-3' exonuclease